MKKVLSVALALVLCLAMCVPAFAADTKDPVDQIADAISGAGIDLGAITDMLSGLGDFDINSITGGDFDIGALTEMLGGLSDIDISSLKDTLLGALGGIGGGVRLHGNVYPAEPDAAAAAVPTGGAGPLP